MCYFLQPSPEMLFHSAEVLILLFRNLTSLFMKKIPLILLVLFSFSFDMNGQNGSEFRDENSFPGLTKVLDSVYEFSWTNSDWLTRIKIYKQRDANGNIINDLTMKVNPMNQLWSNYMRVFYDYGQEIYPVQVMGQYWTINNDWITYDFSHYIAKDRPDETYTKVWDQQRQKFTGGTRFVFTYDNKNLITKISQNFDTVSSGWTNAVKYAYTYSPVNNMITEETVTLWDGTSWINNYRQTDEYNVNNEVAVHIEYAWDETNPGWIGVSRTTHTYESPGKEIFTVTENWNNFSMQWDSVQRISYTFNPMGKLFNVYTDNVNPFTGEWQPYSLTGYSYYPSGSPYDKTISLYNPNTGGWINVYLEQFDSVGQMTEQWSKYIDYTLYQITSGSRDVFTYNSSSQLVEQGRQSLEVGTDLWINNAKTTFGYNEEGKIQEEIVYDWNNQWDNSMRRVYYYGYPNGIDENIAELCTFPNPAKPGTAFSCSKLENGHRYKAVLTSVSGNTLWQKEIAGGQSVTLPEYVASGMYLLQITEKGKIISSQKIILVR